ncbi:MAG TPA: class I SAM-dependent methyltransferase [Vicinamibacterales bacterium]|nr:class I SAM-dependent methyltransferase [Vicinamibacterales bacterium]
MGAGAHLGIDLSEYDARIRTFIPEYDLMHEAVAGALAAMVRRRAATIVELGIGTGALAARCLAAFPSAAIVGVDEDAAMLDAARARLAGRLDARHGSFESIDLPRADAIVTCVALHHLPPGARRQRLFRTLRRTLRPGGVFVNADCFPASHPRIAAADRAAWTAHLARTYPPDDVRALFRRWAGEDHYIPLADELNALRRAGFRPDVVFRRGAFAVIAAS